MPRITKVYTRTGDDGTTALGAGQRVPKDDPRITAYGSVDELNAVLGLTVSCDLAQRIADALARIQNELFHLGSDLCVPEEDKVSLPVPTIEEHHVLALETLMDELSVDLEPLQNFVLPGGSAAAANLHLARTVCRRAERDLVTRAAGQSVGPHTLRYLNRLSDALFVMARWENARQGVPDVLWDSRA